MVREDHNYKASSDKVNRTQPIPTPQENKPAPITDKPNRWFIDGQHKVYKDSKMLNERGVITRLVIVKLWVPTVKR